MSNNNIKFDKETKFLILGDKPLDKVIDKYVDSDQYISYKKYLDEGLDKNVKELVTNLNQVLYEISNGIQKEFFDVDKTKYSVVKMSNFANYSYNDVKLTLFKEKFLQVTRDGNSPRIDYVDKYLNSFSILELPWMDRSGILHYQGKLYSLINSLSIDDSITFNGSKLKFVDNDHSLEFSGASNPKLKMFNKTVTMIEFAIMLFKNYYGEELGIKYAKEFILSLRNPNLIASIAGTEEDYKMFGEEAFENNINFMLGPINDDRSYDFQLTIKIEQGYLKTKNTRIRLNEILSFNHTIGKVISRDVTNNNGKVIVQKGTKINFVTIRTLNRNLIDTIYVEKKINLVGNYLAETIPLGNKIIRGTPVIQEMVHYFPELKDYSVLPKDYDLPSGQSLFLFEGTEITERLCDYLDYIGIKEIKYKSKLKSKTVLTAYTEEEYINNRHFLSEDIPDEILGDISSKYVYIDKDGNVSEPSEDLTGHDIAALLSLYMKLLSGEHHDLVSDPDIGLRKKVNQCYHHFSKAFSHATDKLCKYTKSQLKKMYKDQDSFNNSDKMNKLFSHFSKDFITYLRKDLKVLDILDTSNPVATMSSLTKVNTIVKSKNGIADSQRRLTMGHYSRLCPYETPESQKLGIVNNMALGCRIKDGIMYAPYHKLIHKNGKIFIDTEVTEMTVEDEEKYRIADITDIDYDIKTREVLSRKKVLARIPSYNQLEKMTVASIDVSHVEYVSTSPNQSISIGVSTIPFAGADDAARVSFGVGKFKQSKGLVNAEIPIVCTPAFQNIPNMNTFYKIFAEDDGKVVGLSSNSITLKYKSNSEYVTYTFDPMLISTESIILRVPEVVNLENVYKGQTLVSSNFIKDGVMATGTNALVAYMTNGYNYEDGVPCSERLANKLTSYGVHTDKFSISKKTMRVEAVDVDYNSYLSKDTTMFKKIERKGISVSETFSSYVQSDECKGYIANLSYERDVQNPRRVKSIKVRSVSFDRLSKSDKICNRHGNKGVSCKIHPNSEMYYLENGEFIDILYNPNGIVSRMNNGQQLEAVVGLPAYVLGIRLLCNSFDSINKDNIKLLLSYTVDLANSTNEEEVFSKYTQLPEELHQHCRENILSIRRWKGTFNKEGKAYLINPKSGKRTLTPVNIGVNYIHKLEQEGESKIHSRGGYLTSKYVKKTESPTKGAAKGGGQRQGYMELDAYSAYGATALLSEIMNERGDNYIKRHNLAVDVLHSGKPDYKIDERYAIRRSTEYFFEFLKSLGIKVDIDEFDMEHPEERKYYKRGAIFKANFDDVKEKDDEEIFEEALLKGLLSLGGLDS